MTTPQEALQIVIVGHVDHGKSTLIGRLLHDTGSLPDGKFETVKAAAQRRGMPFEWAFLLDALQAERDQGVTIDTSRIWFRTPLRDYVIIDAPGHREFLKNMVTGAASADAAILVVDAYEGVREQTRRHAFVVHMLGVRQLCVVVNKMDKVDFSQRKFDDVGREIGQHLAAIGVTPNAIIPISARTGDNLVQPSPEMAWYDGPTVANALDRMKARGNVEHLPLRFPIQDVYKFDDRRILVGRIEAGRLAVGDSLLFSPSNKTANVATIEAWSSALPASVTVGQAVGITLDEPLFVERGEIASHPSSPPIETDVFRARLFWLGERPLTLGSRCRLKLLTTDAEVRVQKIHHVIDATDLGQRAADRVERNDVAEVTLRCDRLIALDEATQLPVSGRFALLDGYRLAGGGLVSMEGYADQRALVTVRATNLTRVGHGVTESERRRRNGHSGGVLWLTGLSGAGKSTLAIELERQLFAAGYQAYVLDGDNLRNGLNADLGFSPEQRAENIRRAGEVAALMAQAGFVVVCSFISPYRSDRERARYAAGEGFHEIYVRADLATCEARDPKGLYRRARAGQIADFTGISAPYEEPESPELVIDTAAHNIEASVDQLLRYAKGAFEHT